MNHKIQEQRLDKILAGIQLKRHLVWKSSPCSVYNTNKFTNYVSSEYLNSARKETDEAYRMFEITLLHNETGLRVSYTTSESYDGETVEYKLNKVFIQTESGFLFDVIDVDFEKKIVRLESGTISFEQIRKTGRT
jgi:hypothetical protein